MSLDDKVVLVTGAARGIGRELVRAFVREGARVVATDISFEFTNPSEDDLAFDAAIRNDPKIRRYIMDIAIDSHVKRVFLRATEAFGTVDVIINNGGMRARDLYPETSGMTTVLDTEVGDWQRMFETHVFGTLRVIKAFAPGMLEKGAGSIINVGSIGVIEGAGKTREGPYQPAKAAMHNLTIALADELRTANIAANVLCPVHTHTTGSDSLTAFRFPANSGAIPKRFRPESCVPLALFLARQDGTGVTGQILGIVDWNEANGFGGFETWGHPPDIAAWAAAQN